VEAVNELELMGRQREICGWGSLDVDALGQGLCHGAGQVEAENENE
jgi:hypothetical protein